MPVAKFQIPDSWSGKARCPACKNGVMQVVHSSDADDYLHCSECGFSFEVEDGGSQVRIVDCSGKLPENMCGKWFQMAELQAASEIYAQHQQPNPADLWEPEEPSSIINPAGVEQPAFDEAFVDGIVDAPENDMALLGLAPDDSVAEPPVNLGSGREAVENGESELFDEPDLNAAVRSYLTPEPVTPVVPLDQQVKNHEEQVLDASEQARQLFQLGNTSEQIRKSMSRSPAFTEVQIEEALAPLIQIETEKKKKQMRTVWTILGIVGVFLLISFGCYAITRIDFSNPGAQAGAEMEPGEVNPNAGFLPEATDDSAINTNLLPAPLQTLIPEGMQILAVPTPGITLVNPQTVSDEKCPGSRFEAAQIFGGIADDWSEAEVGRGWAMITRSPARVYVPPSMTGGYLVFDETGMEMRSVIGPVYLDNIYMISISCE